MIYHYRRQPYFFSDELLSETGYLLGVFHGWFHLHKYKPILDWKKCIPNIKRLVVKVKRRNCCFQGTSVYFGIVDFYWHIHLENQFKVDAPLHWSKEDICISIYNIRIRFYIGRPAWKMLSAVDLLIEKTKKTCRCYTLKFEFTDQAYFPHRDIVYQKYPCYSV